MKTKLKNIASIILVSLVMIVTGNNVNAQQRGQQGPPPIPNDKQIEKMVEDLDKNLLLSDEQEKEVSEKYFAHFDEVEAKMKSGRPDRKEMESLKTNFEAEIRSLLTEEQKKKYDTYLKNNQQKPRR